MLNLPTAILSCKDFASLIEKNQRTTKIRIKTYEEQLVEVQEAITAILTGAQEASYNNQKVRKADLSALQAREEYLQKQIALKKRGGIPVRGATPV